MHRNPSALLYPMHRDPLLCIGLAIQYRMWPLTTSTLHYHPRCWDLSLGYTSYHNPPYNILISYNLNLVTQPNFTQINIPNILNSFLTLISLPFALSTLCNLVKLVTHTSTQKFSLFFLFLTPRYFSFFSLFLMFCF